MKCHYCFNDAIGFEVARYGLEAERLNVCKGCSHFGARVHLVCGNTWTRPEPEKKIIQDNVPRMSDPSGTMRARNKQGNH